MLNIKSLIINLFYKISYKRRSFKRDVYNKFINNKKRYPNIQNYLDNVFDDSDSYLETLYRLLNNIETKPICPICNNKIHLTIKSHIFFPQTCSKKCARILTVNNTKINCLKKYGVDNPAKTNKAKEAYKNTCLKKYGVDSVTKTIEHKNKVKNACLKKYGVVSTLCIDKIHKKGVIAAQSKKAQEKRNLTIFKKYNVKNVSQNEEIKKKKEQTFFKHYNVKNNFCRDEIRKKCNSIESKQKMNETKKKNNSFNKSKTEEETYIFLKSLYTDIKRQYISDVYPFACDFYIPSINTYIECNYHWTHGSHPYNENNENDKELLLIWKNKNTKYYNNAIYTWSILDVKKQKIAKQNNLNYLVFYTFNELIIYFKH